MDRQKKHQQNEAKAKIQNAAAALQRRARQTLQLRIQFVAH